MGTRRMRAARVGGFLGLILFLVAVVLPGTALAADDSPRWSVVLTTAAGEPQDIWVSGMGNNTVGWHGGGNLCLGPLADGIPKGLHATLKTDVVQGGVVGPDGIPIEPGTYAFQGEDGPVDYTVTPGKTFYLIMDVYVVESNIDFLPKGTRFQLMFTFDYVLGNHAIPMYTFRDLGQGFVPFLAEGDLKLILKQHP